MIKYIYILRNEFVILFVFNFFFLFIWLLIRFRLIVYILYNSLFGKYWFKLDIIDCLGYNSLKGYKYKV